MQLGLLAYCVLTVCAQVGQNVFLPMAEASFGSLGGVFFVLWFLSNLYTIFFGIWVLVLTLRGSISAATWAFTWQHQRQLALSGLLCALNGYGVVFSVVLSRCGAATQNLIMPSSILWTALMQSLILGKPVPRGGIWALLLVAVGVAIALVPSAVSGGFTASSAFWPFMLIAGIVPGSAMNIVFNWLQVKWMRDQPKLVHSATADALKRVIVPGQPKTVKSAAPGRGGVPINATESVPLLPASDVVQSVEPLCEPLMLLYSSAWQTVAISTLFWIDIIPKFGTSSSLAEFVANLKTSFDCFFLPGSCGPKSHLTALLCLGFVLAYCLSYFGSLGMMSASSPNLVALTAVLPSPLAITVWYVVPGINAWAGGSPITKVDLICTVASLIPSVGGLVLYRLVEARAEERAEREFVAQAVQASVSGSDATFRSVRVRGVAGAGSFVRFSSVQ